MDTRAHKRRSRWEPTPQNKTIVLSPRDVAIFRALYEHGPLSYDYLYELTKDLAVDRHKLTQRGTDLFHSGYLLRPWQLNPQGVFSFKAIVENSPLAEGELTKHGLIEANVAAKPGGPKAHQFMASCITAAFQISIEAHPTLRFISRRTIIKHSANKSLAIRAPITFNGQHYDRDYVPDGAFGVEYSDGGRFYFIIEADRRTEPAQRSTLETSSFMRKVLQLERVIGNGLYKDHFGMKARLFAIVVTTRDVNQLMVVTQKAIGKNWYMLFTEAPQFEGFPRAPEILHDLLTRPYYRVGNEPFVITNFQ